MFGMISPFYWWVNINNWCNNWCNNVAVVVEWLACLPVTQKIGVRFYLERESSATSGWINVGRECCKVILPLHHLTGCDSSSKFGTKAAGLKANPAQHLQQLGKDPANIDFVGVEHYLVNTFKSRTHCESMDQLRYYLYHHNKKTIVDLPPTSRSVRRHILRAFYGTYLQLHCLDNAELNPCEFVFYQDDGALLPDGKQALLPDDFPMLCRCTACATKRCPCRQNEIKGCPYCSCQATNKGCRNPVS